jgi:hypothetical protein
MGVSEQHFVSYKAKSLLERGADAQRAVSEARLTLLPVYTGRTRRWSSVQCTCGGEGEGRGREGGGEGGEEEAVVVICDAWCCTRAPPLLRLPHHYCRAVLL